jgi:hypothetical protein
MEILRNIGQVHIQQLNVQKIVPSAKEMYRKIVLSQCSTTLILEVIYYSCLTTIKLTLYDKAKIDT